MNEEGDMSAVSAAAGQTVPAGRLAGRRAVVTGAGTGIGRAVAIAFAREGASVAMIGRRPARLRDTAEAIGAFGGVALELPCDLTSEIQVERTFARASEAFGGLDTVAGIAGIELYHAGDDRVDRLALEVWQQIIDSNLTSMFLTLKHGTRALLANGMGSVIITGSPTAIRGHALGEVAYSASKAGTHGMVRVMATELAQEHIRVNCVIPGFIDTPINAPVFADPDALAATERAIPMKRAGKPEEIAPIYVWLASAEASYTTGAFFVVDGGQISTC
jgi:NAD(P)-dependent dehydrogenase (short-subunit alcohol dehydrogenase family)